MINEKIKRQFSVLTLVALTGVFLGLSGCATTGQFDDLQRQINGVAADASAAKQWGLAYPMGARMMTGQTDIFQNGIGGYRAKFC